MITLAAGPDWASIMTAIGTVAVAVVAVGVALFAERRADKRVTEERTYSAKQLREERELSEARLQEERRLFREREQFVEAYAVEVQLTRTPSDVEGANSLTATVDNHGSYTITGIEARFSPDGANVVSRRKQARLHPEQRSPFEAPAEGASYADRLTPWDSGIFIESVAIASERITDPLVILRWTDRWGTHWEHKRAEVRQTDESAPWQP